VERGFRFGVQAGSPFSASLGEQVPATASEPRWASLARRAEDHGYDVLSLPDHLDGQLAPLVALGYAAAITDRIRLGTIVLANDFRNPAMLATEAATLDVLSGHRFELGLGAGWKAADYDVAGIPLDRPAARIDRLADAVEQMRALLPATVPIMLGGGGRRMLTLAGRTADIVSVVTPNADGATITLGDAATVARVRERIGWVRDAAADRDAPPELHARVFAATGEPYVADMSDGDARESPYVLIRPAGVMADRLLRQRDTLGITYVTVSERFMDEFAPVIELLSAEH
jgi:probable F420-dependent oxidoreductase